jgi:Xaa-Pro aminopeptidase
MRILCFSACTKKLLQNQSFKNQRHILMPMDVLPSSFFIKSRSKLMDQLHPRSAVFISSARTMPKNGDQFYPYRQSSDMYYLSGIRQQECTLVIFPSGGADRFDEVLFIPEGDMKTSRWEGDRITPEEARKISGIGDVRFNSELKKLMTEVLADCKNIYYGTRDSLFPSNELEIRKEVELRFDYLVEHDLAPLMTRLRMYKEPEELTMIRKAIAITGEAYLEVLRQLRPGMKEYEVAALITYTFHRHGISDHAFDPIVASGKNGLVLHYVQNSGVCRDGELLLMDFGADYQYYAADISRTIPVNGVFSRRQRQLYDAALHVLQQAVRLMVPGKLLRDYHLEVGALWEEQHIRLGLYTADDVRRHSGKQPLWQQYYWHGTSHSIGIDVHDRFDPLVPLAPGMVLSCEPGIYIPEEGVGIRIENDLLVTDAEAVDLAAHLPVVPGEIEAIMNS